MTESTSGDPEPEWYGNADPNASKGTKISGLVHDVTLQEQRLGIAIGIRYALE